MSVYVYVYADRQGRVLYVGRTARPTERIVEHARNAAWWPQVHTYKAHETKSVEDAKRLELFLSDLLQPAYGAKRFLVAERPPLVKGHSYDHLT